MAKACFACPALLADIGGTNARFSLLAAPEAAPSPLVRLETGGFPTLADAAQAAIRQAGFPAPRAMLVGAAGPVVGRGVVLTNANWQIDGPATAAALNLEQGMLFNDFETLALALPALAPQDLMAIGPAGAGTGLRAVIGPGTGLGVGGLAAAGAAFLPIASEGGHIGFGAETADERAIWDALDWTGTRVQAEMLLAGPGLARLFEVITHLKGAPRRLTPAQITATGLGDAGSAEAETIRLWLRLLARFCGDMAVTLKATGGVYLAGGILPRLASMIDPLTFRAAFARNETQGALLRATPVHLITADEPAMIGLAALARQPERYLLDYAQRLWC